MTWQDISTAPKDGRTVLLWMVHENARFSNDPIGEGWAAPVVAQWIDHNGGGWTWYGLCGVAMAWMPIPPPPNAPAALSARSLHSDDIAVEGNAIAAMRAASGEVA